MRSGNRKSRWWLKKKCFLCHLISSPYALHPGAGVQSWGSGIDGVAPSEAGPKSLTPSSSGKLATPETLHPHGRGVRGQHSTNAAIPLLLTGCSWQWIRTRGLPSSLEFTLEGIFGEKKINSITTFCTVPCAVYPWSDWAFGHTRPTGNSNKWWLSLRIKVGNEIVFG